MDVILLPERACFLTIPTVVNDDANAIGDLDIRLDISLVGTGASRDIIDATGVPKAGGSRNLKYSDAMNHREQTAVADGTDCVAYGPAT